MLPRVSAEASGYLEMNVYKPLIIYNIDPFHHTPHRWLQELSRVSHRRNKTKSQKDPSRFGAITDVRMRSPGHWV